MTDLISSLELFSSPIRFRIDELRRSQKLHTRKSRGEKLMYLAKLLSFKLWLAATMMCNTLRYHIFKQKWISFRADKVLLFQF